MPVIPTHYLGNYSPLSRATIIAEYRVDNGQYGECKRGPLYFESEYGRAMDVPDGFLCEIYEILGVDRGNKNQYLGWSGDWNVLQKGLPDNFMLKIMPYTMSNELLYGWSIAGLAMTDQLIKNYDENLSWDLTEKRYYRKSVNLSNQKEKGCFASLLGL